MKSHVLLLFCFLLLCALPVQAEDNPVDFASHITKDDQGYTLNFTNKLIKVESHWPALGKKPADDESRAFVLAIIQAFYADAAEMSADYEKEKAQGTDLMNYFPLELNINYELSAFTPHTASIVWTLWRFTGGAHGQLDIVTNIYDLEKEHPLLTEDLFIDPNTALLIFSKLSREKLANEEAAENGDEPIIDEMLMAGTEPDSENFRAITLIPEGIRLHFQPYQVAPWSAGTQTVDITLQELEKAQPRLEFWGKK